MIRGRDLEDRRAGRALTSRPSTSSSSAPRPLAGEARPFLSPGEVAGYWGVHVDTVYRAIGRGALPAVRVGQQLRIATHDAVDYGEKL